VGNWNHFALTWTNHGDKDGDLGAEANLYINGRTVSLIIHVRAARQNRCQQAALDPRLYAPLTRAHTLPLYARRCTTTRSLQVMTPPTR